MNKERFKNQLKEIYHLIWPFKWYILANLFIGFLLILEYLDPPAVDDPIWNAEAVHGNWNYMNQKLYLESIKISLVEFILVFFLGTSNMRNHPTIAKLIFIYPWIESVFHLILIVLGIKNY